MGTAPTGHVLKAYMTESDALSDSNPLQIKGSGDTSARIMNAEQLAGYNFFTHTKYYFRIEANEPVKEFYIDWNDGEDNNPKGKANYTSIKNDFPSFVGVTSHIFTQHKAHFPLIKVKSVGGFWSKYYAPFFGGDTSNYPLRNLEQLQGDLYLSGFTDLDGNDILHNEKYIVEAGLYMPVFMPASKPPVGILKTDKKRVYAGIDNSWLAERDGSHNNFGLPVGTKLILISSDGTGMDGGGTIVKTGIRVRVTYITTGLNDGTGIGEDSNRGDIITTDMAISGTIDNVMQVFKMELLNHTEASSSSDADYLDVEDKLILTINPSGTVAMNRSIGEVSLGNPIVKFEDPRSTVMLDATESFSRCSNLTVPSRGYCIDDGKHYYGRGKLEYGNPNVADYYEQMQHRGPSSSTSPDAVSDLLSHNSDGDTSGPMSVTNGVRKYSYTFRPYSEFRDNNYRWLGKQLLARCQVRQDEGIEEGNYGSIINSPIEHWVNESTSPDYGECREGTGDGWPEDMRSSNVLAFKSNKNQDNWVDLEPYNRRIENIDGGTEEENLFYSYSGTETTDAERNFYNAGADTLEDESTDNSNPNYIIIARDKKWTSQHWHKIIHTGVLDNRMGLPVEPGSLTTNGGYMNIRVTVLYTASMRGRETEICWKPLSFTDYTTYPNNKDTTWYRSGLWEWQEPTDWIRCDPGTIPNRFWPGGDFEGETDSFSASANSSANYFDTNAKWNNSNKKYGLMVIIDTDGGATATANSNSTDSYFSLNMMKTFPASNSHSQVIEIVDPMCVSLNSYPLAQSMSYSHKGKHQVVDDRLGKADIRKIGAAGGSVKLGGVDLSSETIRDKFHEFQRRSTPVYCDSIHENGDVTRLFGIIVDMSQDHPTAKLIPKFSVNMRISHMIMFNSTGTILTDGYISLGGEILNEPNYV